MSPLSFLHNLYRHDVAYFQRMLDFFLQSRFESVHLWIAEKRREPVFLSTEGAIVHCVDHTRRWKTLTEWYNTITDQAFTVGDPAIFDHIHITRRVTVQNILSTITQKEVDEFVDMKYRSSQVYHWILRRLKARQMTCTDTKVFQIQWGSRVYEVEKNKTSTEGGYSVGPFLDYMCDEKQPSSISWKDEKGLWVLLTEDLPPASVISESSDITPDFTPSLVESDLQEMKDRFQEYVESEKWARDELLEELSCVQSELSATQTELSSLRSEVQEILQSFQGLQALVYQNYQTLQGLSALTNQQEQTIHGLNAMTNQQQFAIQTLQNQYAQHSEILKGALTPVPVQAPMQTAPLLIPYPRFAYRT